MVTSLPAAYRAIVPRSSIDAIAPWPTVEPQPAGRGAAKLTLVLIAVTLGLGLATVTASLVSSVDESRDLLPHRVRSVAARAAPAVGPQRFAGHDGAAQPVARERPLAPRLAVFPPGSAGGPWTSPLYPQNNVTLWDRIRVSTKKDRRAYLLGIAIQLHTPAAAATPGPRRVLPSKAG